MSNKLKLFDWFNIESIIWFLYGLGGLVPDQRLLLLFLPIFVIEERHMNISWIEIWTCIELKVNETLA